MKKVGSLNVFYLEQRKCEIWLNYFVSGLNFVTKASVSLIKPIEGGKHSYFRVSVNRQNGELAYRANCGVSSTRDDLPVNFMFVFDLGIEPDDDKPIRVMMLESVHTNDYCIVEPNADFNDLYGLIAEQELNEILGEQNEIYTR